MDAFVSNKLVSAYDASKAGLLGLARSAAHALGPSGIRVNAVCPGYVRTEMTDLLFATDAVIDHIETKIPLLRVAEADDIATVIRFLLSDEAGYVTGSSITVDGGVTSTRTS
jgi:NAD(P)-dependent dehydrogenase (short-subunit alcohol dehydrogenase family)